MKPISDFHNSFTVIHPHLHGFESLWSRTYVDGTVDVVMDWGFRRWISRGVCMKAFYAFLGKEAFNQTKASAGYFTSRVACIGGTTTMAATGLYTDDEIRRFGRWKSGCWRRYVYAARGCVRGLAAAMSRVHVVSEDAARRIFAPAPVA